jgi:hypothetical protein
MRVEYPKAAHSSVRFVEVTRNWHSLFMVNDCGTKAKLEGDSDINMIQNTPILNSTESKVR